MVQYLFVSLLVLLAQHQSHAQQQPQADDDYSDRQAVRENTAMAEGDDDDDDAMNPTSVPTTAPSAAVHSKQKTWEKTMEKYETRDCIREAATVCQKMASQQACNTCIQTTPACHALRTPSFFVRNCGTSLAPTSSPTAVPTAPSVAPTAAPIMLSDAWSQAFTKYERSDCNIIASGICPRMASREACYSCLTSTAACADVITNKMILDRCTNMWTVQHSDPGLDFVRCVRAAETVCPAVSSSKLCHSCVETSAGCLTVLRNNKTYWNQQVVHANAKVGGVHHANAKVGDIHAPALSKAGAVMAAFYSEHMAAPHVKTTPISRNCKSGQKCIGMSCVQTEKSLSGCEVCHRKACQFMKGFRDLTFDVDRGLAACRSADKKRTKEWCRASKTSCMPSEKNGIEACQNCLSHLHEHNSTCFREQGQLGPAHNEKVCRKHIPTMQPTPSPTERWHVPTPVSLIQGAAPPSPMPLDVALKAYCAKHVARPCTQLLHESKTMGMLLRGHKDIGPYFRVEDCSACVVRLTTSHPQCKPLLKFRRHGSVTAEEASTWCRGESRAPTAAPTTVLDSAESKIIAGIATTSGVPNNIGDGGALHNMFNQILDAGPSKAPTNKAMVVHSPPTQAPSPSKTDVAYKAQHAEMEKERKEGRMWMDKIQKQRERELASQAISAQSASEGDLAATASTGKVVDLGVGHARIISGFAQVEGGGRHGR
jgi:hypothetical protein